MSSDKIQFESEMIFDLTKANSQLQQFQKKFKSQQVEVGVKFDKNSAAAVDRLSASINALKKSGKGLDQFNMDMIDLRKNLSSFSNVPAFTKTAQSITQLSNAFLDLKTTASASANTNAVLQNLGRNLVALGGNAKNISDLGKAMSGIGVGLNGISRAADNISKIENALSRLQKIMVQLKTSGAADVMNNLPGNFSMNAKGQTRMTPVRIVAPSMDEYTSMKTRWESEMARRPIRARISPEMDRTGLQRFQNLLIALSFGQFEANLRRISGQLINNYSQIENAQTTLRTVYRNNPQQADRAYKFLSDYEQKTPFSFEEVIRGGTQFAVQEKELKRVGFDLERVTRMSGELAAAFNGDISEVQTGISRILSGDQNGLEILDKYGISRGVLKSQGVAIGPQGLKLSGQGDIKAVLDAIESFIQGKTGGNLAERRGETTAGIISNLQSQFFKTQASLFEPVKNAFSQGAKFLTSFLKAVEGLPEPIRQLIGGVTLVTSAFLMVAQQAASLGLVLLGMNNAGMFNFLRKGAVDATGQGIGGLVGTLGGAFLSSRMGGRQGVNPIGGSWANTSSRSGGSVSAKDMLLSSMAGQWAGNATAFGKAPAGGVMKQLFPTFLTAAGGTALAGGGAMAAIATAGKAFVAGLVRFLSVDLLAGFLTAIAAEGAVLAGGAAAIAAGIIAAAAALGATVIGTIWAIANPKDALALVQSAGSAVGGAVDMVSGRAARQMQQSSYENTWNSDTPAAKKRRLGLLEARNLGNMSGTEMINKGTTKKDITDSLALTMQKQRDLLALQKAKGSLDMDERQQLAAVESVIDKLLDKRREYNNLTKEQIELQDAELKLNLQIAEARRDIGAGQVFRFGDTKWNKPTSGLEEVRRVAADQEKLASSNLDRGRREAWSPAEILALEAALLQATLRRIQAEKDILANQKAFISNIADLRMGTGGTERENSSYMRAQANLMPANTPDEIRAKEAALNAANVNDYKIEQARKQQRIDSLRTVGGNKHQKLQGGELAAKLAEVTQETKRLYEATGYAAEDRVRIERDAAAKIKQIYFDHYQGLLKLAQDNMQAMHRLQTDRLALLQNVLKKEKALEMASLGRESLEKQYNSQKPIDKMDKKIEQGIIDSTALKMKQAKEKYDLDIQKLEAERNQMKRTASPQALASKDQEIKLRKKQYGLEKEDIKRTGSQDLEEFKQETKFRKEDLEVEATQQILEDDNNRLLNEKENLQNNMGLSKKTYVELIKEELKIERLLLINADMKARANEKKLTTQQKKNMDAQLKTDLEKANVAAATKIADSGISGLKGQAAGLDDVIEGEKTPQGKLVNMKKKLELEKKALYLGYLKDAAQPGADKANLQVKYMQDLTDLQQKYLDQAKGVTAEFAAQNAELMKRYQNENGFTMGEVFGVDQLSENMKADSDYGRMKYDQISVGPKPYSGMPGGVYKGYGGTDPFSKDRFDMKDRLRTQAADAANLPMSANIPGTLKDLQKVDVKAEFVLKVVTPDGKTTSFSRAVNPDVPPKGKGAQ